MPSPRDCPGVGQEPNPDTIVSPGNWYPLRTGGRGGWRGKAHCPVCDRVVAFHPEGGGMVWHVKKKGHMPDFESHITVSTTYAEAAEQIAVERGWKTSEIVRDPLLGDDPHFYLTRHSRDFRELKDEMHRTVGVLTDAAIPVLREKIEEILHDVRWA